MKYPRVLIVYHSCINKADSNTVSLRNWFGEWPKDGLAQIYSGNEIGDQRFCGHTFRLGLDGRRFGRVFFRLKGSSLGEASRPSMFGQGGAMMAARKVHVAMLKYRLGYILIGSGLWELASIETTKGSLWHNNLIFTRLRCLIAEEIEAFERTYTHANWINGLSTCSVHPQIPKIHSSCFHQCDFDEFLAIERSAHRKRDTMAREANHIYGNRVNNPGWREVSHLFTV